MCRTGPFKESDAFIGYQKDTPASVIFHATNLLRKACTFVKSSHVKTVHLYLQNIIMQSGLDIDHVHHISEESTLWTEAVSIHLYFIT